MKKILFFLITMLLFSPTVLAGERDWHVGVSPTALFNIKTRTLRYGGSLLLEKQIKGRNYIELNLLMTANKDTQDFLKESDMLLAGYYKPSMHLGKNNYGLLKFGPNVGFGNSKFIFGLALGFEYNIVFRNRFKLFISQDNFLMLKGEDRFSSGLSLGIKIPL